MNRRQRDGTHPVSGSGATRTENHKLRVSEPPRPKNVVTILPARGGQCASDLVAVFPPA